MWRALLVFVWMLALVCVMLFVRVEFGKLYVCCFVMSVIYGVRCCELCLFVCVVCERVCYLLCLFVLFVMYCVMLSGLSLCVLVSAFCL